MNKLVKTLLIGGVEAILAVEAVLEHHVKDAEALKILKEIAAAGKAVLPLLQGL